MGKWRKRRKPNPWVAWEDAPPETPPTPRRPGHRVIRGETLPLDRSGSVPLPRDRTEQIIADFTEMADGESGTQWQPPPSWGGTPGKDTGKADRSPSRPHVPRRKPRLPELARVRLPAPRPPRLPEAARNLPAPPWWILPAAARAARRHAPRTARAALWLALGAAGILAGAAAVYGLTRVAALRWDIALPTYAVVAGIAARLIQEMPRALTRWTNRKGTR